MFNAIRQFFAMRRLLKQRTLVEVARSLGAYYEIQITPECRWTVNLHPIYLGDKGHAQGQGIASDRTAAMYAASAWIKSKLKTLATSGEL